MELDLWNLLQWNLLMADISLQRALSSETDEMVIKLWQENFYVADTL